MLFDLVIRKQYKVELFEGFVREVEFVYLFCHGQIKSLDKEDYQESIEFSVEFGNLYSQLFISRPNLFILLAVKPFTVRQMPKLFKIG